MQQTLKDFDPNRHDLFSCLTMSEEIAKKISRGETIGYMSKNKPRVGGQIMIIAHKEYSIGEMTCLVDVESVKRLEDLDFDELGMLLEKDVDLSLMDKRQDVYVWRFKNPKRVIELPVIIQGVQWDLVMDKGDVFMYPIFTEYLVDKTDFFYSKKIRKFKLFQIGVKIAILAIGMFMLMYSFILFLA